MLLKNLSIFDLDNLFNDNEILKDFIVEIFEICQQINEEMEQKFGIIFAKVAKNEYLVLDYKILILALLRFMQKKDIETFDFINEFSLRSNDLILNLLFILGKRNLVYFSDIKKYYTKYKLCISNNNYIYSTRFNGIAIKYPTILKLFSNDKEMICEFEKLITRNFEIYKNRDKSKRCFYFSVENYSQFNDYFHNN